MLYRVCLFWLLWFCICILKLLVMFRLLIGGGGMMNICVFWICWMVLLIWLRMVFLFLLCVVCLLKFFSLKKMMFLLGEVEKLVIDRLGKVIELMMLGIFSVMVFMWWMIFLVWFRLELVGNWVMLIRYCLLGVGMKLFGMCVNIRVVVFSSSVYIISVRDLCLRMFVMLWL